MKNLLLLFVAMSFAAVLPLSAQKINWDDIKGVKARNIGPAGMSGRMTSIDVDLSNDHRIIAGAASGGVWLSESGGIDWKPIFDEAPLQAIGSVKINQANTTTNRQLASPSKKTIGNPNQTPPTLRIKPTKARIKKTTNAAASPLTNNLSKQKNDLKRNAAINTGSAQLVLTPKMKIFEQRFEVAIKFKLNAKDTDQENNREGNDAWLQRCYGCD